eukprot:15052183-Alexandrium_andersonii.AAC.1
MSASLVGSEMCIRDSSCGGPSPGGPRFSIPCPPLPETLRGSSPPRARAVSYTHLTLPTICSV